ncbi:hypothetical protein BGX29_008581 [Mortierella sp. GBA35]|nr:hypothetical protein BGX23_010698 [Mortierella sp. AD031]KAF9096400.1 hypothetical protein BGX29_008581 [Mortierella sp. GBA35]KAG0201265.1 hypothetical protein BGX33_010428 [Mortierella sp. NVP41]
MLAKAVCLVAALISNALCYTPPSSSKTVDPKKEIKVVPEYKLLTDYANKFHIVAIAFYTLETALYLILMANGSGQSSGNGLRGSSFLSLNDQAMLSRMGELQTWHKVATMLCLLGYALRKWSFVTLDRFFTYQLTIRTGHKLVQSGPYTYLRHPSYTGAALNGLCFNALLFHQGLWDVTILLASRAASTLLQTKIVFPSSVLGIQTEVLMFLACGFFMFLGFAYRVCNEEAMLKSHFGKDWDVYASKRWRFIPFVY